LRSLPLFAELPGPALEALAASLTPVELPAGTVLIRQGDPGDAYYAIATGELDVQQDGRFLRRCGRGEGVGEIALLHSIRRTATVIAHSDATVYRLNQGPFLSAVLSHAQTYREASRIAGAWLAADVARDNPQRPSLGNWTEAGRLPLPSSPGRRYMEVTRDGPWAEAVPGADGSGRRPHRAGGRMQ
jgi:hypothetical protein